MKDNEAVGFLTVSGMLGQILAKPLTLKMFKYRHLTSQELPTGPKP